MTWVAVGTAAAIGAGVGAGSQIIQGKSGDDILKGALLGGATGALTGGAGAAFGGTAGATGSTLTTETAAQLAPELVQTAATNVVPEIAGGAATNVLPEIATQTVTSAAPTGIAQIPQGFTAAEINAINMGNADALASAPSSPFAPLASGPVGSDAAVTPLVQTPPQVSPQLIDVPPGTPFEPSSVSPNLVSEPPMNQFQGSMTRPELAQMTKAEVGSNPFVEGFNDVTNYIEKNPFKSAAMGYLGLNAIGAFRNAQQPMTFGGPSTSKTYSLSPNFRPGPYTQPNVYEERRYNYASGGIAQLQSGGPVERMSMMNTAMNPQGGLYPQGMIDKTQYATPIQRPVSSEMVMEDSAYERSNPMLMAEGGEVKGYAPGGQIDMGNGYNPFANLPPMSGPLGSVGGGQRPAGMQPMGSAELPPGFNPFRNHIASSINTTTQQDIMGGDRRVNPLSFSEIMDGGLSSMFNQPTGQSTFPGAASMQGGFGQGAQGYSSFTMGSGGFGGGGSGGPFPLEGQYGIVKMASGGIASFAKGTPRERDSYSEFQRYHAMMEGKKPTAPDDPAWVRSVGIMEDTDPDTKYQDALTAALIRQGKINKRANMGAPTIARPMQMGAINLAPPGTREAAAGGIMGYSLGGYADGGNPRLLKGPGDGMSDNIPASIADRQPARLADGEFVVPADVVSGLGNGSTNAGARKLHKMMDKVRVARTGKKKQAPAIKAEKYLA